ncbi:MAG: HPP family protein [Myxococcota bacterium]
MSDTDRPIRTLMNGEVVTIDPQASLAELEKLLAVTTISGVPVLDEGGELVGIVSKTDLTGYYASPAGRDVDAEKAQVWQIMSLSVIAASAETPIPEVARMMMEAGVHRVVLRDRGHTAGIVTSLDFVRLLAEGPSAAPLTRPGR